MRSEHLPKNNELGDRNSGSVLEFGSVVFFSGLTQKLILIIENMGKKAINPVTRYF